MIDWKVPTFLINIFFSFIYSDYNALHTHFKESHFACDQCTENFAGIFRSDIDLKAHMANAHGKSMGKLQEKQTRTLQLDITLGPRNSRQIEAGVAHVRSRVDEPSTSTGESEKNQIFFKR